jgi:hypothetical protein
MRVQTHQPINPSQRFTIGAVVFMLVTSAIYLMLGSN